jgi:hypothetical protein
MPRRPALALAVTIAVVVMTGGFAVAANYGLLSRSQTDNVGRLNAANVAELTPDTTPDTIAPAVTTPESPESPDATEPAPEAVAPPQDGATGTTEAPRDPAPRTPAVTTAPATHTEPAEDTPAPSTPTTQPTPTTTPPTTTAPHPSTTTTTERGDGGRDD